MNNMTYLTDASLVDAFVHLYTVFVLLLILAHCKKPEENGEEFYVHRRNVKSDEKKNWRDVMTGFYHQCESSGFDDWLKFANKPFPVRLIAPKLFHRVHMDLKLGVGEVTFQRFRDPEKQDGDPPLTIPLGSSRENAPPVESKTDKPDDCGIWRAWINDNEEKLHALFEPDDPNTMPTVYLIRELLDRDTVFCTWNGTLNDKQCCMTTTYRRVSRYRRS